jgi:hypothetical protein
LSDFLSNLLEPFLGYTRQRIKAHHGQSIDKATRVGLLTYHKAFVLLDACKCLFTGKVVGCSSTRVVCESLSWHVGKQRAPHTQVVHSFGSLLLATIPAAFLGIE